MSSVCITGIGVISALGNSVQSNHEALIKGVSGIGALEIFNTKYSDSLKFGEVKIDNKKLAQLNNIYEKGITRTSLLALHAMKEAVRNSGLTAKHLSSPDTALVAANTVGGMCLTDELYKDATISAPASEYLASYDYGSVTLFLQKQCGIKGICNTINTACSSSVNAIMFGARLISNGLAKRAIVGGSDSLAKFTINGFNSLGILSQNICRPFDNDRDGLNLGEGAAFIVLEREEDIGNKKVYAKLSGYCNANDAFHASSLSDQGDGPYKAMQGALKSANISSTAIDYINTHGTGTQNNDLVEGIAMRKIFEKVPAFVSSKSKIGHTLGAAGAIEAVFSILAIENQEIYPALNFFTQMAEVNLVPDLVYKKMNLNHVLNNSFGFGGNCSSLVFSKA